MSHKISVDFTGLCLFATKKVPKRLSVLLARDTMKGMEHRPLLSFDIRNLRLFNGASKIEVIQLPDGRQIAIWNLDGKLITLNAGAGALPGDVTLCRGKTGEAPFPEHPWEEMDLRWVPSLGRITGQDLNPIYLEDKPVLGTETCALSARLDINRGFLFSNAAVNRLQPPECWTIPTVSGKPIVQYLADSVRLEIDGEDKAKEDERILTITASSFGGGDTETLELIPDDRNKIEISITNFPQVLPKHDMPMTTMPHFGAYYDLLNKAPDQPLIPVREDAQGQPLMPMPPSAPGKGVHTAMAQGIFPAKCSPGMTP